MVRNPLIDFQNIVLVIDLIPLHVQFFCLISQDIFCSLSIAFPFFIFTLLVSVSPISKLGVSTVMASKKDLAERAIDNSTGQDERNVILRTTVYVDEGTVLMHFICIQSERKFIQINILK